MPKLKTRFPKITFIKYERKVRSDSAERTAVPYGMRGIYGSATIVSIIGNSGDVKEIATISVTKITVITSSIDVKKATVAGIQPINNANIGGIEMWSTLCILLIEKNSKK